MVLGLSLEDNPESAELFLGRNVPIHAGEVFDANIAAGYAKGDLFERTTTAATTAASGSSTDTLDLSSIKGPLPMDRVLNDITDLYKRLPMPLKAVAAPNVGALIRKMSTIKRRLKEEQRSAGHNNNNEIVVGNSQQFSVSESIQVQDKSRPVPVRMLPQPSFFRSPREIENPPNGYEAVPTAAETAKNHVVESGSFRVRNMIANSAIAGTETLERRLDDMIKDNFVPSDRIDSGNPGDAIYYSNKPITEQEFFMEKIKKLRENLIGGGANNINIDKGFKPVAAKQRKFVEHKAQPREVRNLPVPPPTIFGFLPVGLSSLVGDTLGSPSETNAIKVLPPMKADSKQDRDLVHAFTPISPNVGQNQYNNPPAPPRSPPKPHLLSSNLKRDAKLPPPPPPPPPPSPPVPPKRRPRIDSFKPSLRMPEALQIQLDTYGRLINSVDNKPSPRNRRLTKGANSAEDLEVDDDNSILKPPSAAIFAAENFLRDRRRANNRGNAPQTAQHIIAAESTPKSKLIPPPPTPPRKGSWEKPMAAALIREHRIRASSAEQGFNLPTPPPPQRVSNSIVPSKPLLFEPRNSRRLKSAVENGFGEVFFDWLPVAAGPVVSSIRAMSS